MSIYISLENYERGLPGGPKVGDKIRVLSSSCNCHPCSGCVGTVMVITEAKPGYVRCLMPIGLEITLDSHEYELVN